MVQVAPEVKEKKEVWKGWIQYLLLWLIFFLPLLIHRQVMAGFACLERKLLNVKFPTKKLLSTQVTENQLLLCTSTQKSNWFSIKKWQLLKMSWGFQLLYVRAASDIFLCWLLLALPIKLVARVDVLQLHSPCAKKLTYLVNSKA
jgi:hypothetical protein